MQIKRQTSLLKSADFCLIYVLWLTRKAAKKIFFNGTAIKEGGEGRAIKGEKINFFPLEGWGLRP